MKITSIKIKKKEFRVVVSDIFSTNDELRATICIDMGDEEYGFFQEIEYRDGQKVCIGDVFKGAEIELYMFGNNSTKLILAGGLVEEGGEGYIIAYICMDDGFGDIA